MRSVRRFLGLCIMVAGTGILAISVLADASLPGVMAACFPAGILAGLGLLFS